MIGSILIRDHGPASCLSMIFFRNPVPTFREHALEFRPALERRFVLQAVVAGEPRNVRLARPLLEDAADILARDAGHGGKIALRDLLAHQNAAATHVVAETIRKAEQGARDA